MSKLEHTTFEIDGTTIDMGENGKFAPGTERRLAATLNELDDGEDIYNRLVQRGAIVEVPPEPDVQRELNTSDSPDEKKKEKNQKSSQDGSGDQKSAQAETDSEDEPGSEDPDTSSDDSDESGDDVEQEQPDYEPTGQYEINKYAGGMAELIDPDGFVIDNIRGYQKAEKKRDELNKEIDED